MKSRSPGDGAPNACHCKYCGIITKNTGTLLCEPCWCLDRALDHVHPDARNAILADRGVYVIASEEGLPPCPWEPPTDEPA